MEKSQLLSLLKRQQFLFTPAVQVVGMVQDENFNWVREEKPQDIYGVAISVENVNPVENTEMEDLESSLDISGNSTHDSLIGLLGSVTASTMRTIESSVGLEESRRRLFILNEFVHIDDIEPALNAELVGSRKNEFRVKSVAKRLAVEENGDRGEPSISFDTLSSRPATSDVDKSTPANQYVDTSFAYSATLQSNDEPAAVLNDPPVSDKNVSKIAARRRYIKTKSGVLKRNSKSKAVAVPTSRECDTRTFWNCGWKATFEDREVLSKFEISSLKDFVLTIEQNKDKNRPKRSWSQVKEKIQRMWKLMSEHQPDEDDLEDCMMDTYRVRFDDLHNKSVTRVKETIAVYPVLRHYELIKKEFLTSTKYDIALLEAKLESKINETILEEIENPVLSRSFRHCKYSLKMLRQCGQPNPGLRRDVGIILLGYKLTKGLWEGPFYKVRRKNSGFCQLDTLRPCFIDVIGANVLEPTAKFSLYVENYYVGKLPSFYSSVIMAYCCYWIYWFAYEDNISGLFNMFDLMLNMKANLS